jgi:uncharacterized membrane protein
MKQKQQRGQLSRALWCFMWLSWFGLLMQQAADVERFAGTWALTGLRCLPLLCFLWAAALDSLKLFIWFDLILLFYFISAVEAVFAYQADGLSVAGLTLVVTLFVSCMLYIRYRSREIRPAAG